MKEEYTVVHESSKGVFVRTLTGLESGVCAGSEFDGCSHTTFSVGVTFAQPISAVDLKSSLRRVLIRLRHLTPAIAYRLSKLPSNGYQFAYVVPRSAEDAAAWVDDVLIFEPDGSSFTESHERVVRERWWKASENRYTHEYHVTAINPTLGSSRLWALSLSSHHSNIDGRSAWMILDKALAFLTEDINGTASGIEGIKWGDDVKRLPPAPTQIWSIEEKGHPEPLPPPEPLAAPPEGFTPWLYTPLSYERTEGGDYVCRIAWSREDTARLHTACKEHGKTITQAVTALVCLANGEAALRNAANKSPEAFKEVSSSLANATHLATGLTSMNIRGILPKSYQTLDSEHSTPLYAADAFALSPFGIEPYREMLHVNETKLEVTRTANKEVFWNEMVKSVADSWKAVEGTFDSFKKHTSRFNIGADRAESDPREGSMAIFTSFGDMTRLGLLESFRPPSENKTLVVDDIDFTTRSTLPGPHFSFFQYDGRFVIKLVHGKTFASKDDTQLRARMITEWFDILFMNLSS